MSGRSGPPLGKVAEGLAPQVMLRRFNDHATVPGYNA